VGHLSGDQIIRDLSNVDTSIFERFYQNEDGASSSLEFEPTNLDIKADQFIDPFSPDLFKDEIIDIDFGAIDAFTTALNAQLNAEKTGTPAPQNLQFPSHILTSNHASFIDNQLLLGDSSINAGDGSSGINVQFISSSKDFNQSNSNLNGSIFRDTDAGYSRSNSFGSIIDIQSQSYATSQATRPTRSLVIDNVPNELAGLINLDDLNTALNRISADLYASGATAPQQQQQQHVQDQYTNSKILSALQDVVKSRQNRAAQANNNYNQHNNMTSSNSNTNDYVLLEHTTR
jgi:hypothetical protein